MEIRTDNDQRQEQEREANLFAMGLLMPEEWVRKEVRKLRGVDLCSDGAIKSLAKKFGVSHTLMAVRLGQICNL